MSGDLDRIRDGITAPSSPIGESLGQAGEGAGVTISTGKDQGPAVAAEGWWEWGKRNQFGAGGAVQWARDTWTAVGKIRWTPGGKT